MKYLVLLGVVLAVLWLLRQARKNARPEASTPPATAPKHEPTEIVACARCGVHLPRDQALPGARGHSYCCAAHLQESEGG